MPSYEGLASYHQQEVTRLRAVNAKLLEALEHCKATIDMIPPKHFTSRHKASAKRAREAIEEARK